jgi:hypothetical protein
MLPSFEGEHLEQALGTYLPQGQVPRFPHEYLVHPDTPHYDWVDWKSSARKVTHPSAIPALGRLTSEFPKDQG